VLLDNSFATLPHVVAEGRRVIGNIERVANLFLTKTVFSVLLAILIGAPVLFGVVQQFPFLPRHLTLLGALTIGIPAFFLALAPNPERARPGFVKRVLRLAAPSGIIAGVATYLTYKLAQNDASATPIQASTAAVIALYLVATWVLIVIARPYVWWKFVLVAAMVAGFVGSITIPFAQSFWQLDPTHAPTVLTAVAIAVVGSALIELLYWVTQRRARNASTPAEIAAA
jgi:cation-transporting ATPase E